MVCVRIAQCRPHQQPITEMHSEGGRILTGGQDHVLKVIIRTSNIFKFFSKSYCTYLNANNAHPIVITIIYFLWKRISCGPLAKRVFDPEFNFLKGGLMKYIANARTCCFIKKFITLLKIC